jgi:hypothetical protein
MKRPRIWAHDLKGVFRAKGTHTFLRGLVLVLSIGLDDFS